MKRTLLAVLLLALAACAAAQEKRYVIIDQDAAGPGGTDQQSILVFLQAPNVEVLGITVVTGDAWRDEEAAHTLRTLELVGRTDVPVLLGAAYPLVRTQKGTELWEQLYGKVVYKGAWGPRGNHPPFEVPPLREGNPTTKVADEDAAHFMVRMVRKYPHQVTIYAGGPMTNLALALALDPQFAELTKGLIFMGGAIAPKTDVAEFATNPRHEFNLWFDPEATHIVLRAKWPSIVCTTVDVSLQTKMSEEMLAEIVKSQNPTAQYMWRYSRAGRGPLWDELAAAAWLEPSLITREVPYYMDVNLDRGAAYGDLVTWNDRVKPGLDYPVVHTQMDVDMDKFGKWFVQHMSAPTPKSKNALVFNQPPPQPPAPPAPAPK
ncbi:MAG TPA: nucleoside hydrolase [Terriglobales bacterium]|nr:nucleoside hydrolase [Terriglobales bacterium]